MTSPPILVTGGTGTLGRQVVSRLREADREVWVLSRRSRTSPDGPAFVTGDLATGDGLPAAVQGAGTIVHCASSRKGDAEATRNLVRAAQQAEQGLDARHRPDPGRSPVPAAGVRGYPGPPVMAGFPGREAGRPPRLTHDDCSGARTGPRA